MSTPSLEQMQSRFHENATIVRTSGSEMVGT